MKIAAYQAPLNSIADIPVMLSLIRGQIKICESNGVEILCCPEGVLGGLADYAEAPGMIAYEAARLEKLLAPLASDTVTTIVGFTEIEHRNLYNSAAVFHQGSAAGVYRKHHPAINRSVYTAGGRAEVFTIGGLTFGIIICNDSNFDEPATLAGQGAKVIFIPTNNGLPKEKNAAKIAEAARACDIRIATENNVYVVRADVAGSHENFISYGSSEIVSPDGAILCAAPRLESKLIIAEIQL